MGWSVYFLMWYERGTRMKCTYLHWKECLEREWRRNKNGLMLGYACSHLRQRSNENGLAMGYTCSHWKQRWHGRVITRIRGMHYSSTNNESIGASEMGEQEWLGVRVCKSMKYCGHSNGLQYWATILPCFMPTSRPKNRRLSALAGSTVWSFCLISFLVGVHLYHCILAGH